MVESILEIVMRIVLVVGLIFGLIAIPLGLSGNFIILGLGVLYDLAHGFHVIGWWLHVIFLAACILGEIQETLLGSLVARRYGAGRWGMIAAFAGGILGAVAGTPILPLVGTLIGSMVGAFAAAFAVEWYVRSHDPDAARRGFRAGWGAFVGKILASSIKIAIGAGMAFTILIRAFR